MAKQTGQMDGRVGESFVDVAEHSNRVMKKPTSERQTDATEILLSFSTIIPVPSQFVLEVSATVEER